MSAKEGSWSSIKEILFTYLAISKTLYWVDTITALNQSDLGNVGQAVLMRFLGRDFLLIVGVIAFFFLNKLIDSKKSKHNKFFEHLRFYIIGYFMLFGITFIYMWILNWFYPVQIDSWGQFIGLGTVGYLAVIVVINAKYYFKEKEVSGYAASMQSTDDKLTMLKVLLQDGILTPEEFDLKKKKLQTM